MRKPKLMFAIVTTSILALSLTQILSANADESSHEKNHCHRAKHSFHEGGPFSKNHDGLPAFLKDISLTDIQKTQIKAIVEQQQPTLEAHFKQRHTLIAELIANPTPEVFDEKKSEEIANQIAALEKEVFLNRAKTGSQIFALLTPEQRKKVAENMKKHQEKMQELKAEPANFTERKQSFLQWIKG